MNSMNTIIDNNSNIELLIKKQKGLNDKDYRIEKIVMEKNCDVEFLYKKILPYKEQGYEILDMQIRKNFLIIILGKPVKVEEQICTELPYGIYIDKKISLKDKYSKLGYILEKVLEKGDYDLLQFQLK